MTLPILEEIKQRLQIVEDSISRIKRASEVPSGKTADESDAKIAQFVKDLIDDSETFDISYFQETDHLRRHDPDAKKNQSYTRKTWRKIAEALAFGNNWGYAWGHRDKDRQERVDGEIPRKLRVRKDHITANYHEFTVTPNIVNMNEWFDEERKRMGWKHWIETLVDEGLVIGSAINEVMVDYNLHPQGQVVNVVRKIVYRTPGATSFNKSDGCHYVIIPEIATKQQIEEDYEDVKVDDLDPMQENKWEKARYGLGKSYNYVKFYEKFRMYIDDPMVEKIPFGQEEELELAEEHLQLTDGVAVKAKPEQNHIHHIVSKLEAIENYMSQPEKNIEQQPPIQAQDQQLQQHLDNMAQLEVLPVVKVYVENILEHLQYLEDNKSEMRGWRKKYPNGRYICIIGGKTIKDLPNPLETAWRKLFREVQNTSIVGRMDGAGDPEVMFDDAFQSDIMLSRMEDIMLMMLPKVWRPLEDKANGLITENDDNDPKKTSYYTKVPPTITHAEAPQTMLRLYEIRQGKLDRDTGVNTISEGNSQGNAAYRQVAIVQEQNRLVVTGGFDRNLNDALEDIIEADLAVMKVIYKTDRQYYVNGKVEMLNIAKLLSYAFVDEGGKQQKVEVPSIEVSIKRGSNYPQEWERKLALLTQTMGTIQDPSKKTAMEEAIFDHIAIEYPDFATGGKYRVIGQATQIGMQILQQQQEVQAQREAGTKSGLDEASRIAEKQIAGEMGNNGR